METEGGKEVELAGSNNEEISILFQSLRLVLYLFIRQSAEMGPYGKTSRFFSYSASLFPLSPITRQRLSSCRKKMPLDP